MADTLDGSTAAATEGANKHGLNGGGGAGGGILVDNFGGNGGRGAGGGGGLVSGGFPGNGGDGYLALYIERAF